jgi:hypothetical protein
VVLCLITFTILWVLARVRVFHQRNGVFFAAALVCLLGASVPLVERGYIALDRLAHTADADEVPVVSGPPKLPAGEPNPCSRNFPKCRRRRSPLLRRARTAIPRGHAERQAPRRPGGYTRARG